MRNCNDYQRLEQLSHEPIEVSHKYSSPDIIVFRLFQLERLIEGRFLSPTPLRLLWAVFLTVLGRMLSVFLAFVNGCSAGLIVVLRRHISLCRMRATQWQE